MSYLQNKSTFCVLPWIHYHVNTDGYNIPCCLADNHERADNFIKANSGNINETMNSQAFKKMRREMLQDKEISFCKTCYEHEEFGNHSGRLHSNAKYLTDELEYDIITNTQVDGTYEMDVLYFDVRFSNVCNYKCRMCGAKYSTKWYEDLDYTLKDPIISIENIIDFCNKNYDYLKNLKYVYFAGGEPLVQKEHYQFLEWCVNNGIAPELYYQSNGSVLEYGKYDIFNLWKNFAKVTYSVSIDGHEKLGEYIRTGYKQNKVENNMSRVCEFLGNNAEITVNSTFMAYNAFYITEFFDHMHDIPSVMDSNIYPQLLLYPEELQPKVLPNPLKLIAIDKIEKSKWYSIFPEKFEAVLNNLKSEGSPILWNRFVNYTKNLDEKRDENILNVFPELRGYYE